MISILIPTRDYDCHLLVEELHRQGKALGTPFEILVAEDGTDTAQLHLNAGIEDLAYCRRIVKKENIGRARIRNLLATEARYANLIFIDSDAIVEKDNFLKKYTKALEESDVVCGGLYHANCQPNEHCSLRYRYEKKADSLRDAATRSKAPYDQFTTFNFAIKKTIFTSILFDTAITGYGYEDALFGKELEKRNIRITHIDNPLLHCGLEKNEIFLAKTEQALRNLATIKESIGNTPLIAVAKKLKRYHIVWLFMLYWRFRRKSLRKNLLGSNPSLEKFNIYKLGYYITACKNIS